MSNSTAVEDHNEAVSQAELPPGFAQAAQEELTKFLRLWRELRVPLAMFSAGIDRIWHDMLADRPAYSKYCEATVGLVVGHGKSGGVLYHGVFAPKSLNPAYDWIPDYENRHGPLPDIWFTDESGVVDQNHLALYREVGVIVSSWECTPQN